VAWARFQENWGVLLLAQLVFTLIAGILGELPNLLILTHVVQEKTTGFYVVSGVGFAFSQIVGAFFNVGLTRIWLDAARGAKPKLETLFSGADRFLPMLGLVFASVIASVIGCLAFVVPAIFLGIIYPLAPYYVVEGRMGPIDALLKSWNVSRGQRWELLLLLLYGFGLSLLGLVMCCVGWFVTWPIYLTANAVAFTRIAGIPTVTPAPETPGPMQPPYGPGPHDLPPWR
jgi:hypothetical protein